MNEGLEGRVTRRPAAVLMRAGTVPAVAVGALVAAGFAVSSPAAAASVGIGVALAIVALSAGPLLLALMRSVSPPAAMLLALIAYGAVVMLMAVVYLKLLDLPWLSGDAAGAGIGASTVAWLVGLIRAVPRLRIPLFGSDSSGPDGAGRAGHDGSSTSSPGSVH